MDYKTYGPQGVPEDRHTYRKELFGMENAPKEFTWRIHHLSQLRADTEETRSASKHEIPPEYQDLREAFEDLQGIKALPENQPWDHAIELKWKKDSNGNDLPEREEPHFMKMYPLNENQKAELHRYIEENLAKGYIQQSKSPAGYPILFVPKKDGTQRLCVDY